MASCVVDASAIIAWLFNERGADTVDQVLDTAAISAVNLAEVLYRCDEEGMATGSLEQDLRGLGLSVEPFTADDAHIVEVVRRAARDAGRKISLADCCCLATGVRLHLPVLASDRAWESLSLDVEVRPFR